MAKFHPVQAQRPPSKLPESVTRAAYEVYCHVYGPQAAMVDLEGQGCRGGFSLGEIIAFLYARSFPKVEWAQRVDEAFKREASNGE